MREAIKELTQVVTEHLDAPRKFDITILLNTRDVLEVIQGLDVSRYDFSNLDYSGGDIYYLSSQTAGDFETSLWVESAKTQDGDFKYDETDVLIIPSYIEEDVELFNHVLENGYEKIVRLSKESTYETLAKDIEY